MDNIPPNSDRPNEPENDSGSSNNDNVLLITNDNQNPEVSSEVTEARNRGVTGGNSLESEEATSSSGALTSASSTEVESLAASLIRAQDEHRRAEAEKAKEEKTGDESCKEDKNIYHVKWISYNGSTCGIVTQNSNGPCPLIAIINVLSLRKKLSLPQGCEIISAEQLLEFLADLMINIQPDSRNLEQDFHHNMNDAITILPKLQTGLDVNVRFTSVREFEYTPECIVFDLLSICLYHGWLVDPQLEDLVLAIGSMSYNQVVESIISGGSSDDQMAVSKSILTQQFLEESASQLTYHGICELNSVMKDGQLAVFFRNNHFSTMVKEGGSLYLLVTDLGFLDQEDVVWETLDSVQGDTVFVDKQFKVVDSRGAEAGVASVGGPSDHELAMSLQRQDAAGVDRDQAWTQFKHEQLGEDGAQLSDEELARRLQEAEMAAAQSEAPSQGPARQSQPQHPIGPRDKKCAIL